MDQFYNDISNINNKNSNNRKHFDINTKSKLNKSKIESFNEDKRNSYKNLNIKNTKNNLNSIENINSSENMNSTFKEHGKDYKNSIRLNQNENLIKYLNGDCAGGISLRNIETLHIEVII